MSNKWNEATGWCEAMETGAAPSSEAEKLQAKHRREVKELRGIFTESSTS